MQLYNSIRHDTSPIKYFNYNRYGDVITTLRTLFTGSVPLSVKSGCGGNFLSGFVCRLRLTGQTRPALVDPRLETRIISVMSKL